VPPHMVVPPLMSLTARIAYGLGTPERDHDPEALDRLQRLADTHDNLTLVRVDDACRMT